ncbi:hypothetical protein [Pseudonocardia sp. GCM10023141]|uniref:hypothetical protein n=1 Tax=Pseudonocardia sp. GCM10023141 TaxID=3252653 RepID=UPI0036169839
MGRWESWWWRVEPGLAAVARVVGWVAVSGAVLLWGITIIGEGAVLDERGVVAVGTVVDRHEWGATAAGDSGNTELTIAFQAVDGTRHTFTGGGTEPTGATVELVYDPMHPATVIRQAAGKRVFTGIVVTTAGAVLALGGAWPARSGWSHVWRSRRRASIRP